MKKIIWALLLGLVFLAGSALAGDSGLVAVQVRSLPESNDPEVATVNCATVTPCTFTDLMGDHEGVRFTVQTQQNVTVRASFYLDSLSCDTTPTMNQDQFNLAPGDWIIYRVAPAPPGGSSATWTLGTCPETDCATYPTDPC